MTMVSKYKKQLFSGIGLVRFLIVGLFILSSVSSFAQFTIDETFKGAASKDVIIGDGAYLTSGIDDPVNAGWLRLTKTETNQKGFAYINKSFPSTLGVLIDFEYKMWRNKSGYNGADGIGVFLFDGKYGPVVGSNEFKLGGYGGSLGYAGKGNPGLSGGYVGIGLDAYGNFANTSDGPKFGGTRNEDINGTIYSGERPNSIVLRGPTTTNASNVIVNGIQPSNRFLTGFTIKRDGTPATDNLYIIKDRTDVLGSKTEDQLDYNTVTSTRPSDNTFYRRVQIEITPVAGGLYKITVRWKKSTDITADFVQILSYTTTDVPPSLLKLGFAASTGGDLNYHDIRNVLVTTPGNLRVSKRADKDILRSVAGADKSNEVTYSIEVVNDTDAPLRAVDFKDKLTDGSGVLVTSGVNGIFNITSITHSNFDVGTVLPSTSATNEFSGTLNMKANSIGKIIVKGTLNKTPVGNVLTNTVTALPTDIVDEDLGNNTAIVNTPVLAENVDLVINTSVVEPCLDPVAGNNFKITVANMGSLPAQYGGGTITRPNTNTAYPRTGTYTRNRIEVTQVVPAGFQMTNEVYDKWDRAVLANTPSAGAATYVYTTKYTTITGSGAISNSVLHTDLVSGTTLPVITFKITRNAGVIAPFYVTNSTVRYLQEVGVATKQGTNNPWVYNNPSSNDLEVVENRNNNASAVNVVSVPSKPVVTTTLYYCQGAAAVPLTASVTAGNRLVWYLTAAGGVASNVAFTPSTATAGTTSYYVSQTNGNCESELAKIDVIVMQAPTPGTISSNEPLVCRGSRLMQMTNVIGTGADGSVITYRWEVSLDDGVSWSVVQNQTDRTYSPTNIQRTTLLRRTTIATLNGKSCESVPTSSLKITVKNCTVISNPMLPSKARSN